MSNAWSWYVIILTLGTLLGLGWLLYATTRPNGKEDTDTTGHVWDDDLQELNNPLPRWWLVLFLGTIMYSLMYLS